MQPHRTDIDHTTFISPIDAHTHIPLINDQYPNFLKENEIIFISSAKPRKKRSLQICNSTNNSLKFIAKRFGNFLSKCSYRKNTLAYSNHTLKIYRRPKALTSATIFKKCGGKNHLMRARMLHPESPFGAHLHTVSDIKRALRNITIMW